MSDQGGANDDAPQGGAGQGASPARRVYPPPPPTKPGPHDGTMWPTKMHPIERVVALGICADCGWVHPVCKGHRKSNKNPCEKYPAKGQMVCDRHGAKSPQALAAADARLAKEKAERTLQRRLGAYDGRLVRDPAIELARLAGEMQQAKETAASLVAELVNDDDAGDDTPAAASGVLVPTSTGIDVHPYVKLYERLLGQYRGLLVDMGKLSIDARLVAIDEAQAHMQMAAILAGLADAGVDTPDVRRAIADRLRQLDEGEDEPIEATGTPTVALEAP